jgi:hypothetical protein
LQVEGTSDGRDPAAFDYIEVEPTAAASPSTSASRASH